MRPYLYLLVWTDKWRDDVRNMRVYVHLSIYTYQLHIYRERESHYVYWHIPSFAGIDGVSGRLMKPKNVVNGMIHVLLQLSSLTLDQIVSLLRQKREVASVEGLSLWWHSMWASTYQRNRGLGAGSTAKWQSEHSTQEGLPAKLKLLNLEEATEFNDF